MFESPFWATIIYPTISHFIVHLVTTLVIAVLDIQFLTAHGGSKPTR